MLFSFFRGVGFCCLFYYCWMGVRVCCLFDRVTSIGNSATDTQLPSAQAVNERIVELVTEVG